MRFAISNIKTCRSRSTTEHSSIGFWVFRILQYYGITKK